MNEVLAVIVFCAVMTLVLVVARSLKGEADA